MTNLRYYCLILPGITDPETKSSLWDLPWPSDPSGSQAVSLSDSPCVFARPLDHLRAHFLPHSSLSAQRCPTLRLSDSLAARLSPLLSLGLHFCRLHSSFWPLASSALTWPRCPRLRSDELRPGNALVGPHFEPVGAGRERGYVDRLGLLSRLVRAEHCHLRHPLSLHRTSHTP
jgi:hypothetical protein